MSDDHTQWFIYADENLAVARLALDKDQTALLRAEVPAAHLPN